MRPLPPGPASIGFLEFIRSGFISPEPLLKRYASTYGDPFRLPTKHGPLTVTGAPEAIRAIYTADPDTFGVWGARAAEPVFGTTSLVVATGAHHRRDRKLLTPSFNTSTMRAYAEAIAEAAGAAAARWAPGRPFSMLESTQAIALDIIVRVVFGVEGEARVQTTRAAVLDLLHALHPLIILFPSLRRDFGGVGPWARHKRALTALDALLSEQIHARRAATGEAQKDIVSLMLSARDDDGTAMSEAALIDQLRTLLFAGHETTAVALAWTLYLLHREPEALARVQEEIAGLGKDPDPDAFASLPYLEAACLEGLRMHPPVVDVGRVTRKPFDLMGYTIPAGEGILPSPLLLHAREDLYPEPERFRPSRFLERKFSPFEYIPFGGGARRCLGAAFALYEMKVVLGTLLGAHRLRLASPAPIEHVRRGITMGPRGGVPMILEERRVASPARSRAATAPSSPRPCPFHA
jgi:cytochrome P450